MKALGPFFGIVLAVAFHAGVLLFGGLFFLGHKKSEASTQEVELLADVPVDDKKPDEPPPPDEELETSEEAPPDAAEVMEQLQLSEAAAAPELEAASLGAIEAALSGQAGGGGDFASAMDFASGGRIGGTGKAGLLGEKLDDAFSMSEIDQKPRAIFQASPSFPAEMRGKKTEGLVTIIFVVDAAGRVTNPKVEKSSHGAFEKPALDAIRKWKFEAGVRGGQRVASRMRQTIRFPI